MSEATRRWRRGTLVRDRALSASARSLTFAVPDWPGAAAGQHVDVRLTAPDGYQAVRSYSLARAGTDREIELAVERLPDGEVSPFLVDELEPGDEVELRGPLGGWFVWRPGEQRPVQLIAGGSGIVPLVAIARAHAAADSTAPMRLLASVRTPESALYRDELEQLRATAPTRWHYTRVAPPGWTGPVGRLSPRDLEREVIAGSQHPLVYVCGPTGFVEAVARTLIDLGQTADSIRTERFGGT